MQLATCLLPIAFDHALHVVKPALELLQTWAIGEPDVALVPAELPPLTRVDVKEDPWRHDHLLPEHLLEEAPAGVQGPGELPDVAPAVEGALGGVVHGDAHVLEPPQEEVALVAEERLQHDGLLDDGLRVQQRHARALGRQGRAAVQEGAGGADRADDALRRHDPADAEARHAPALREAVEQHHRFPIHIFYELRCRNDAPMGIRRSHALCVNVSRVDLIKDESALCVARDAYPALQIFTLNQLPSGVAWVGEQ
mmetsp:Transcript_24494/g.70322  ORF Transcript_24494/g.70322 Transcript_24494/m.70322 type:complete len:254 (-) Transcript_24494:1047-1808(-)